MSANVTENTIYSWYCAECGEGGDDLDDDYQAETEADAHNAENHPPSAEGEN